MDSLTRDIRAAAWLQASLLRVLAFAFLFWILSEGETREPLLPLLVVLSATFGSLLLWPPGAWPWRVLRLVRFTPYFLWQSILGGIDVARRVFHPSMPLATGFLEYPLRLRHPSARVFFVWTVSLLPGTVVSELDGRGVQVHALDVRTLPIREKLKELEEHVAALFGEQL
jgi:multicomponent Na+:H+ antiporter subunit E